MYEFQIKERVINFHCSFLLNTLENFCLTLGASMRIWMLFLQTLILVIVKLTYWYRIYHWVSENNVLSFNVKICRLSKCSWTVQTHRKDIL